MGRTPVGASAKLREKQRRIMRRWRHHPCQGCDTTGSRRQFAHRTATGLNGRGRGQERRYYDIVKHPESYVLLCSRCHGRVDCGAMTLPEGLTMVEIVKGDG